MMTNPLAAVPPPVTAAQTPTTVAQTPPAAPQEQLTQFLSLLTTQIRNQDPLEPMDSTGFVEQLATFSTLEQQVQGNAYLAEILDALRA